jgi:hypothetical protein
MAQLRRTSWIAEQPGVARDLHELRWEDRISRQERIDQARREALAFFGHAKCRVRINVAPGVLETRPWPDVRFLPGGN